MNRHQEIRKLAFELWERADRPDGRDLDFWLAAEKQVDNNRICVLGVGNCPHQHSQPLNGGRHCAVCHSDRESCRYRAAKFNSSARTAS